MGSNWMKLFLAQNDFLVSGAESFARVFGLPEETRPSVRFVAFPKGRGYISMFFLIAENVHPNESPKVAAALRGHPVYYGIRTLFDPLYVLLAQKDGGFFLDRAMTPHELAKWFHQKEPRSRRDIGTGKATNKLDSLRKSDLFRVFTGKYLTRHAVSNDIDAIRLAVSDAERPLLLELKKPRESIKQWRPYTDDCANFAYLRAFARHKNIDFRIICYNVNQSNKVQLVLDPECEKPNRASAWIDYKYALVTPQAAVGPTPPLQPGRSTRKRQVN